MAKRALVGKSGVTPCKHDLLNKLLGREAGSLKKNPLNLQRYGVVDLTAGDGMPFGDNFFTGCSPGIILKHCVFIATHSTIEAKALFIEKQPETYAKLRSNLETGFQQVHGKFRGSMSVDAECADSKLFRFPPGLIDGAFLYNDPNHIEHWCLEPDALASAPKFTTSLSTLGCNVGGLKRIDLDRRELWFDRVNMVTASIVQPWHDACLLSVGGADQWAYLITAPSVWRDRITSDCIAAATKIQGREASPRVAWFKAQPSDFLSLQRFLFLTKTENANS